MTVKKMLSRRVTRLRLSNTLNGSTGPQPGSSSFSVVNARREVNAARALSMRGIMKPCRVGCSS